MKTNSQIDLTKCRRGDKLVTRLWNIVTYESANSGNPKWPHEIRYEDGSYGTRTDNGYVFSNPAKRLPSDDDIIAIVPRNVNKQTLKEAGYTYVRCLGPRVHLLKNNTGKLEVFIVSKNHASWGLIWNNTHLEFASSYDPIQWI